MKKPNYIPLDVNWIEGKAGAQRLATALLAVNGQLLDSYKQPNFKRATYHVRVAIAPDKEQEFRALMSGYVVETPWRGWGDNRPTEAAGSHQDER